MTYGSMDALEYFEFWYPLPVRLPEELAMVVFSFAFNPLEDPW
jgi:hypothetical protein